MVSKNFSLLMLLFVTHSVLPMEAGFTPNEELVSALKSYNVSKVKEIIATMPKLTQQECDYYHYLAVNEASVWGIRPRANLQERLAVPTLIGTPSLAILATIFGISSVGVKKILENWKQPTSDSPPSYIFKYHSLKALYYSLLLLTGASVIGSVGLASTFVFHAYYPARGQKMVKLLGKHKAINQ